MRHISFCRVRAGLGLALGLCVACGKATSPGTLGGETHWLQSCNERSDDECAPGLECVCGVCTLGCSTDASCGELSSDAACAAREMTPFGGDCRSGDPERLCVRRDDPGAGMGGAAGLQGSSGAGGSGEVWPVEARPYVEAGDCFGAREVVGWLPAGLSLECSPSGSTRARDAAGNCWLFQDGCLWEGFVALGESEALEACGQTSAICAGSQGCPEGEVAVGFGCLTCGQARGALRNAVEGLVSNAGFDECSSDRDCLPRTWQSGCEPTCRVAVNAASTASFISEVRAISGEYCGDPQWSEICGPPDVDCPSVPLCRDGRCLMTTEPACEDRDLASCTSDGDCELYIGTPYDPARQCFSTEGVAIACVDGDLGPECNPILYQVLDADGNCYAAGGCLPTTLSRAPAGHECINPAVPRCE